MLAIIVILAIIAVITIPIILNVIENTRKGAAIDSAFGYRDAIHKFYLSKMVVDDSYVVEPGEHDILYYVNEGLEVNGTIPSEGWVIIDKNEVTDFSMKFGEYAVTYYSSTNSTEAVKGGSVVLTPTQQEIKNVKDKALAYVNSLKTVKGSATGIYDLPVEGVSNSEITTGWVALLNGEAIGYSLRVDDYVVTRAKTTLNNENVYTVSADNSSNASIFSKTIAEAEIKDYYIDVVRTDAASYISSLSNVTYDKTESKTATQLNTEKGIQLKTDMDGNSWVFFEKSGSTITITDYKLKFTKGEYSFVVKYEDGTLYAPSETEPLLPQKDTSVAFKGDSWATFIANIQSGDPTRTSKYEVGDTTKIKMTIDNQENEYTLRIANKPRVSTDEDYAAYIAVCSGDVNSQTACGWVIEFADVITTHRMNKYSNGSTNGDGNKGGWEYSDMRAYLNNGIYLDEDTSGNRRDYSTSGLLSLIPEPVKSAIIDTRVVSGHGSNDTSNFTTTDKLYLLSRREVWNYIGDYDTASQENTTRQIDYYQINGVTTSDNIDKAIKKNLSGNASLWWLRSAYSSRNDNFSYVYTSGYHDNFSSGNTSGVAPAFRLAN